MKRYEKMTKEELIEFLVNRQCGKCKADEYCDLRSDYCEAVMQNWLNEEVETKPRWATIKSNEDCDRLSDEYVVDIFNHPLPFEWLKEEVEV